MLFRVWTALTVVLVGAGVSAAPANGKSKIPTVRDGVITFNDGTIRSFEDPAPTAGKLVARGDHIPQWLRTFLIAAALRGWLVAGRIGTNTVTHRHDGPVPTMLVVDKSPPPRRVNRNVHDRLDDVNDLTRRQAINADEEEKLQIEAFKLYINSLTRKDDFTALCSNVNATALEQDGIDGEAVSSYLCAEVTGSFVDTEASLTVDASQLGAVSVQTPLVSSIPKLAAPATTEAVPASGPWASTASPSTTSFSHTPSGWLTATPTGHRRLYSDGPEGPFEVGAEDHRDG
ncbi:MAG: hypothetical protein M1815_000914 [Lichina confinis]|nr:MAG: hypothetical protein M1815_000914 [Lichina confinis]